MGLLSKSFILLIMVVSLLSCSQPKTELKVIASSDRQWTGVAVSSNERIFVNFPKWSDNVPVSVAEIIDGEVTPYPNSVWQNDKGAKSFMAVQSVVVDKKNRLWILDTRNPQFKGVNKGGPILYQFNLKTNKLENEYRFGEGVFTPNSYFNDVRVDTRNDIAYMTDSGNGALIVLNLRDGESRRLLDNHYSTESEVDFLICDGINWKNSVHSDGIALSPDNKYLYYIALTGHTLYRISTADINNSDLSDDMLANRVEKVATIPATDGMMFDKMGNLWLGGLEDNSVNVLKSDGTIEKVIKDDIIRWADSFAIDKSGNIYFTTSQIHLPNEKRKQYQVLRLNKRN
ncbi:MAG: major royal jelly family protein [Bacteroidales bacterium]|jgi:sugar lactone lactonase YvrE|nr:major royal jelly family protein [Bacteroidales bacterium]